MSSCYLAFIEVETECAGCTRPVAAGLAAHTDVLNEKVEPICWACLAGLDGQLFKVQLLISSMPVISRLMDPEGDPEQLAAEVRELLQMIRPCLPD